MPVRNDRKPDVEMRLNLLNKRPLFRGDVEDLTAEILRINRRIGASMRRLERVSPIG